MRAWVILALALSLIGCAAFKQATIDAKACLADPDCREEAVSEASNAKSTAIAIAGVSPIPLSSNLVGGVVYGGALIFALIRRGRKKREEGINP